ncbi:MAG TPA: type IV pilus secretin PilQ, partial [Bdellovibrionales bacterium]|nr:type IV pilus secretin PilQ [Bdellovibrionales bacterium]
MKRWLLRAALLVSLAACTNGKQPDTISDIELPEDDGSGSQQTAQLEVPDAAAAETIDAEDVSPTEELVENEGDTASSGPAETPPADAPAVRVVGLDFKGGENGGTIIIRTTGQASYTTRTNESNQQFIVEIANAELPVKYRRPYNTKEFSGPIAGIQAYQKPGTRTARFVVQLKESIDPLVMQDGNILRIAASGEGGGGSFTEGGGGGGSGAGEAQSFAVTSTDKTGVDGRILSNSNLDAFLLGQSKFYGRKISFQVKDADVRDVFNFLAEESGLNIILSDEVTGKITVKLRKIPWDQALITIMKSRGLGYVRQGNILRIAPLVNLQREADAARTVIESQTKLKPVRVRVFPVSYAKVKDLEQQSRDFLSERGRVRADERTNSLIVNDIEDNLERIAKLITILDTQTPQVLIESRVVEARQSFVRQVGVNWSFSGDLIDLGTNSNNVPLGFQLSGSAGGTPFQGATGNLNLQLGTLDFLGDLSASLSLYELDNLIKVISAPRIMTLNGQKAKISQKTQIPVATTTVSSGQTSTSYSFKDVELSLEVVPQITADGGIIMAVKVKREFLGSAGAGQPNPVNTREADTTVLINNGQTIVMGGIYQSDAIDQEEGVPFLRKVP